MHNNEICTNEIRDFIARAPKRLTVSGSGGTMGIRNNAATRYKWMSEISLGTIHERINRRAGIKDEYKAFHYPVTSSQRRKNRREILKAFGRKNYVYQS